MLRHKERHFFFPSYHWNIILSQLSTREKRRIWNKLFSVHNEFYLYGFNTAASLKVNESKKRDNQGLDSGAQRKMWGNKVIPSCWKYVSWQRVRNGGLLSRYQPQVTACQGQGEQDERNSVRRRAIGGPHQVKARFGSVVECARRKTLKQAEFSKAALTLTHLSSDANKVDQN